MVNKDSINEFTKYLTVILKYTIGLFVPENHKPIIFNDKFTNIVGKNKHGV